ncbi:MAG TPA: ABC transporter permease subunit [Trebonia sp.]|nr:ABC transporter permease subunit [Trebonia sp.]
MSWQRVRPILVGAASLAVGVLLWWAVVRLAQVPSYVLPGPGAVVQTMVQQFSSGGLGIQAEQTAAEIVQGGVIGAVIGIVLAMLFYRINWLRRLLMPLIVVIQVTPKISIAPLIVLWVGLGIGSKITLVTLVVVYPVLVSVLARLASLPQSVRDLARIVGMGPVRRAWKIEIPFALPALAAGLKLGALQAVTAAVIGEYIGSSAGLGFLEKQGQDNADMQIVLLMLGLLAMLGWLLYALIGLVEHLLTRRLS